MKRSVFTVLAMAVMVMTAFFVIQETAQSTDTSNLSAKYAALIDETVTKCQKKADMLDSKSPHVRQQAFDACLKAAYLKAHKKELVSYLMDVDAVPNLARVQYHLNQRFHRVFDLQELYALLADSQMLKLSK